MKNSQKPKKTNILIGVTGGIACYKIPGLCRLFKKDGHDVRVIMTENACNFITPLTFESVTYERVYTGEFEAGLQPGFIEHIDLAAWADVFIVAPATANTIAKAAAGICDNLLLSTLIVYKDPVYYVPSMNTDMLNNPLTQANIEKLKSLGHKILDPAEGELACKASGKGRMPEPEEIFQFVSKDGALINSDKPLAGKKVLVTAGPTREYIDPVRYITNRSSGKMGISVCRQALMMGAEVTLIAGPVSADTSGIDTVCVETAEEMLSAVQDNVAGADILIMAAAVADYKPGEYSEDKIKKESDAMSIALVKNPDILSELSKNKKESQVFCGFAAESRDIEKYALDKLRRKNLDMIVANDISRQDIGFETDDNEASIFFRDGRRIDSGKVAKGELSELILSECLQELKK